MAECAHLTMSEQLQRRRFVTALVFAGMAVVVVLALLAQRAHIHKNERLRREDAARDGHPIVQWENVTLRKGERVRIFKRAGTFKPEETRFTAEIEADAGHIGTVVAGERRTSTEYMTVDPNEPIQIVRVRWDPQRWSVYGRGEQVDLGSFEATIHVSYLESADR
jgi:hypothetical protein